MGQAGRWTAVGGASLVLFGLCVWLGDVLLPWAQPERIATGAGAGAVLAGVLVAWTAWRFTPPSAAPRPSRDGATASGERSVAVAGDSHGVIVTGDGNTVRR